MYRYEVLAWEDGGHWDHDSVVKSFRCHDEEIAFDRCIEFIKINCGDYYSLTRTNLDIKEYNSDEYLGEPRKGKWVNRT